MRDALFFLHDKIVTIEETAKDMGAIGGVDLGSLRQVLDEVRKDLLDFGMRNPLLNFKPLKTRGVELIPSDAAAIFASLVTEGRPLAFSSSYSKPNKPQLLLADSVSPNPPDDSLWRTPPAEQEAFAGTDAFPDGTLLAAHGEKDLEDRLRNTYYAARTSIEEQGVNTLFLALGMLSWHDPAEEELHRAPLLLIPVELSRESAADGFKLRYSGDDVSPNLCLIEFLKQFEIQLEGTSDLEEFEIDNYFEKVENAIASHLTWSADRSAISLGFFSFSKFLMYRDLDSATWPDAEIILQHDILQKLLGNGTFAGEGSGFADDAFLDEQLVGTDCFHVMDADSTQTLALLDVASGRSIVVQGPPGTGKSQTIVNMIADAVVAGKKVLFVSEKQAALQVVKQRLDKLKLGDPCLELHSSKSRKKDVIQELKRVSRLDFRPIMPLSFETTALTQARAELNKYCQDVNRPFGASQERPIDLFGEILSAKSRLQSLEIPFIDLPQCSAWDRSETLRRRLLVKSLQDRLASVGVPKKNRFWGCSVRVLLPSDADRLRHTCTQAAALAVSLKLSSTALADVLKCKAPLSPEETEDLCKVVSRLLEAPLVSGLDLSPGVWPLHQAEIRDVIAAGNRLRSITDEWSGKLTKEAWATDISELRSVFEELGSSWWRFLSGRWRATDRRLRKLLTSPESAKTLEFAAILDAISKASSCHALISSHDSLMQELYRTNWRGPDSDWSLLDKQLVWMCVFQRDRDSSVLPEWTSAIIADGGKLAALPPLVQPLEGGLANIHDLSTTVLDVLQVREDAAYIATRFGRSQQFGEIEEAFRDVGLNLDKLDALSSYLSVRDQCSSAELTSLLPLADEWPESAAHLMDLFDYTRASFLLSQAFAQSPTLVRFDANDQTNLVTRFRELDLRSLDWSCRAVVKAHAESAPQGNSNGGQLGFLYSMFERRSRFPPIRKLMTKSGNAIQALKPVFMMSPLSVANFLPPGAVNFDLVIFDEASQVRPADALGAIVRGKQAIVVGDSKQLPPTSFFDSINQSDDEDDEEEIIATKDIESILGLFSSRRAHQRMLRWHYRSRHESLIAGSNDLFYDNKLVVFPSAHERGESLGLIYKRVNNAPYDRSRSRTNPVEARTVAEAVIKHATAELLKEPKSRATLGVAAFSVAQRDAILDELEKLRRAKPGLEEFFATPEHEPFFVKNLENVQGDERDVIFISVGYGRTAEGYLSMGFGPVNRDGGERRLNVLFTRARRRCEVFTALSADDIEVTPASGAGLRALKYFLYYAEHGHLGVPEPSGSGPDSPFEEQVLDVLRKLGFTVETQIGCAGFFIDMAIINPQKPGRYLIGIECDGASYHSARSARDRDRLRESVLRGLGWKLHRIWSTAWFRQREREVEKLIEAIEASQASDGTVPGETAHPSIEPISSESRLRLPVEPAPPPPPNDLVRSYEFCPLNISLGQTELHLVSTSRLVDWLAQVVAVESPIHWLEASRRIADAVEVQRLGSRIQNALKRACITGSRSGKFSMKDGFLTSPSQPVCIVRDRSAFPSHLKKLDYVSPAEISAAIEHVVRASFGMSIDEAPNAACRLLGFARVTEDMRDIAGRCIDDMIARGRLQRNGGMLVC